MNLSLRIRLIVLFFLQPFACAMWMLPFGNILTAKGWGGYVSIIFAFPPAAALFVPLIAAAIADLKVPPVKVLRATMLVSSLMMLGGLAAIHYSSVRIFLTFMAAHAIFSAPSASLSAAIILSHSKNASSEFPIFRLWPTISFIAAGLIISFALSSDLSATGMLVSAITELVLVIFTYSLPQSKPEERLRTSKGWLDALGIDAAIHFPGGLATTLLILLTIIMCLGAEFFPYTPQLLLAKGVKFPSALMTVAQWSEIVFLLILPVFISRIHAGWLMYIGLLCSGARCLCMGLYALFGNLTFAIFGLAFHGPITAFTFVAMQIFMEYNLPVVMRNRSQALIGVFGGGIGPLVGVLLAGVLARNTILPHGGSISSWMWFWSILLVMHVAVGLYFYFPIRKFSSKRAM